MAEPKTRANPAKYMALRASLVYGVVAGIWIVISDELAGLLFPDAAQLQVAQTYKGGLFVLVTSLLLYILIRNIHSRISSVSSDFPSVDLPVSQASGLHGWVPFLTFLLLALAIGATGYYTFHHYEREIRVERQQALSAIADLKVHQIDDWLAERRGDGEVMMSVSFFASEVESWLQQGAPAGDTHNQLLARMRIEMEAYHYARLVLFDAAGTPRLTTDKQDKVTARHEQVLIRQAVQSGKIVFSDMHRGEGERIAEVDLDMMVPLLVHDKGGKRVAGVLYFRIDPRQRLYSLIQSMPIPSETEESLLVRKEGNEVVFLNELRHRHGTALNLRLPLSTKTLPAAMLMRGEEGMVEGVDYRGVPVLAAVRRVAGTPWGLVVKMDVAEIYAPIRRLAMFAIVSTLVFVALAGLVVALWWRQQRTGFAARQYQLELARKKSETDYRSLFGSMLNGFALCEIIVDDQGVPCDFRYLEINPAFERLTGLKRDAVVGKRVREVIPDIEPRWIETYGRVALSGEEVRFQDYVVELGIYFEVMAFCPEKGRFAAIFDNISERKLAERKVARLTSLYATLSQSNQAIVRISEREPLFREICRIAVEYGGFKFVWIGLPESESGKVRVAASYGDDMGYLADIDVSLDPALPQGRGPTGTALREGRVYIANDYAADSNTASWRAALSERGILAAAAYPLLEGGKPVGVLTLYASEINYFDPAMTDLLKEMAMDISFALDSFTREKARLKAEESLRLDALVFESSSEGMLITDGNNRFISVNRAFTEITGYTQEEVQGRNPSMLKSDRQDDTFYRNMWDVIQKTGHWQGELWNRRKNGDVYPEWLNITLVRDTAGKIIHHIGTMTDISSRKLAEEEIYHLTRYDSLTGLPNKFLLEYLLTQAIGSADEFHHQVGVMMVNLDNFHAINDSAGYAAGDHVLMTMAQRLTAVARAEDAVARLGADNFVVVEVIPGDLDEFIGRLENLLVAIAQPIEVDGREIQLNASMGVSFYPGDGIAAIDLVQKAGTAVRHTKDGGGNNYSFFALEMNSRAMTKMALSNDLRHAQERGEMQLHYQTQVDTFTGEIVGVEALLRWHHGEHGLMMPKEFIGLAEESGLIVPIGDWVLREACRQMKAWHDAGHSELFVSVNVSALQFRQGDLAQTAMKAIRESGLEPRFVELELTESMIMGHFEQTQAILKELKAFGVRFSIDDFGTGYSSLSYLKHFPLDKLKIDMSFITDIATDSDNAAIVKAMIAMGHSLELKVIAEGVETEAQAGYLRTIHCDEMQGFYFSKPLSSEEVSALLGKPHLVRTVDEDERVLLLVDDEANVISALKRVLRRDGYRILTAASAQEGLDLLAKHNVGVILSDQRMPNMTGIEFLSKVKVMYPDIVRMVLSGYTEVNTMSEAINRGAIYKFLTKPWEDEPLRASIKEAFLRYETERGESTSAAAALPLSAEPKGDA